MDGLNAFHKLMEHLESVELRKSLSILKIIEKVKFLGQLCGHVRDFSHFDLFHNERTFGSATRLLRSTFSRAFGHFGHSVVDSTQNIGVFDGAEQMGLEPEHQLCFRIIQYEEFQSNLFWRRTLKVSGLPYNGLCALAKNPLKPKSAIEDVSGVRLKYIVCFLILHI